MKRKISCPDFAFPLLEHDGVLKLIHMIGVDGVDIGLFENRSHLRPKEQFSSLKENAEALKKKVKANGLIISDIFVQGDTDFYKLAANHYDKDERRLSRDLFLKTLEYAKIADAQHVTFLPGVVFEKEGFERSYERCVKEQRWRSEKAAEYQIPYGCEVHIGSLCESTEIARQLCEDSGMRLTLDYSHFVRAHLPDKAGDCLIPYANHFHLRGAGNGVLQTAMRDNQIDFGRILTKMDEAGYKGWFCTEYCWTPEWEGCYKNDNLSDIILAKQMIEQL